MPVSNRQKEELRWHELVNAQRTKKILSGMLSGIEKLEGGWNVAIVYFDMYRVVIPLEQMLINLKGDNREQIDVVNRILRIANNMLGAEIDFIVRDLDSNSRSVVGSRADAMMKKRQTFYFSEEEKELPMIHVGRIVEARVIAVAEKVVRLECFGVETSVRARDMDWLWIVDAREEYAIGDKVPVVVKEIQGDKPDALEVQVSAREARANTNRDNLLKLQRQGKYVGIITDVHMGTYFIRLNNGVNAVAHSTNTSVAPGKKDQIGFLATRIDLERETAEGIITRLIKQNL